MLKITPASSVLWGPDSCFIPCTARCAEQSSIRPFIALFVPGLAAFSGAADNMMAI